MTKHRSQKNFYILSGIITGLCVFLAVGVMLVFHACGPKDDGTWMSCHYAQLTVFGFALAMTFFSIIAFFMHGTLYRVIRLLLIVCAVMAMLVPGNFISLCMMNEMRCRAVMRPSVILLGILIVIFAVIAMVSGRPETADDSKNAGKSADNAKTAGKQ